MTTKEVIDALVSQGFSVEYYKRPAENDYANQGFRITKVNSRTFPTSNAEGNNYARTLLKPSFGKKALLSAKQKLQRKRANPMTKLPKLTKKQQAVVNRANRVLRKIGKGERITSKNVRRNKMNRGWGEAKKSMRNVLLKTMGFAYHANVQSFIDVLDSKQVMPKTSAYLKRTVNTTLDSYLMDAWQFYYDANQGHKSWEEADEDALNRLKQGHTVEQNSYF